MRTVSVMFGKGTSTKPQPAYDYLWPDDLGPVARGDLAVVRSPNGWRVVSVTTVVVGRSDAATKYAVCRVPTEKYDYRLQRDAQRATLRASLAARKRHLTELADREELAARDPEAADLVRRLNELED